MRHLEESGVGKMKCFGQSMRPIFKSGSTLTFQKQDDCQIGDIVFCKVKGGLIDAHKIIKIHPDRGYLIANNHGFENGWTHTIYGKAIRAEFRNQVKELCTPIFALTYGFWHERISLRSCCRITA